MKKHLLSGALALSLSLATLAAAQAQPSPDGKTQGNPGPAAVEHGNGHGHVFGTWTCVRTGDTFTAVCLDQTGRVQPDSHCRGRKPDCRRIDPLP